MADLIVSNSFPISTRDDLLRLLKEESDSSGIVSTKGVSALAGVHSIELIANPILDKYLMTCGVGIPSPHVGWPLDAANAVVIFFSREASTLSRQARITEGLLMAEFLRSSTGKPHSPTESKIIHTPKTEKKKKSTEYVYFIQCGATGAFKVGFSKDPKSRLASLQTAYPHDLTIVKTIRCSRARDLERQIHSKLSEYRLRGEWFRGEALPTLTPEDYRV